MSDRPHRPALLPHQPRPGASLTSPRASVPWRVASIDALPDMKLRVEFADGTTGEVDLGPFLSSPRIAGTVFEALRDPGIFLLARLDLGAVTWPNGADLAPDSMYDAIREHGVYAPEA